jgi:uncharacterized protein YndB with AHSA1/START domain
MNTVIERFRNDVMTVYSDGTELVFERTFDAQRDIVWAAFMDPSASRAGGAPTAPRRPFSRWTSGSVGRGATTAPRSRDVVFHGEYLEIEPPERFTWTFLFDVPGLGDQGGPETFTFEDLGGRTKVTSTSHFSSPDEIEEPSRPA